MLARALILALVLPASVAAAQDRYALDLLRDWIRAVQTHVPGTVDPPLTSIAKWNREDLTRLRPFVRALAGWLADPRRLKSGRIGLSNANAAAVRALSATTLGSRAAGEFVKRAALLHTDVVLLVQFHPGLVPPPAPQRERSRRDREAETPMVIARGPDGRFEGFELGNMNWDYARDLLEAVTPEPAADDTVRLWYRAIGAHFASLYSFGEAWPHFERAARLLPDDAGVLFAEGAVQETLASPRIQDYVKVTRLPIQQQFLYVTAARKHLENAERLFSRAMQIEPGFTEARLRLGRVIGHSGRHEAALVRFTEVIEARPDPVVTFYAHLFSGDSERALQRHEAARRSYQRALDLFPRAQSVRIALSHLARLRSDREGAMAWLQPSLSAPPQSRNGEDDPWWDYHRGDGRQAEALLSRLRAPFLSAPEP